MNFPLDDMIDALIDQEGFIDAVEIHAQNRPQLEDERVLDGSTRRGVDA